MIKQIILDLDGVIVDFTKGVFDHFGVTDKTQEDVTDWDWIVRHICNRFRLSRFQFYTSLDTKFWANLPFTKEAEDILALLGKTHVPFCVVTSPTFGACNGKQQWISRNLPDVLMDKRYLIGPAKSFCASYQSLLIDDSDVNCADFNKAGGKSVLLPRPWNANRNHAGDPVGFLKWALESYRMI